MQSLPDTAQSQFPALQVALAKGVSTGGNTFQESSHLFEGPSEQLQNHLINDNYLFPCVLLFLLKSGLCTLLGLLH